MGCYARCKTCNANLYFLEQKEQLQFPLPITCNTCFATNNYLNYEITEERHDYKCSFCEKSFFIKKSPPLTVRCPHCSSQIYVNSDGTLTILLQGELPSRETGVAGGLLGGAAIGSLFGPAGALLGGILGAALGYEGLSREAIYDDGYA